jgi:hypothetical protein
LRLTSAQAVEGVVEEGIEPRVDVRVVRVVGFPPQRTDGLVEHGFEQGRPIGELPVRRRSGHAA